jgi:hypothetical protein
LGGEAVPTESEDEVAVAAKRGAGPDPGVAADREVRGRAAERDRSGDGQAADELHGVQLDAGQVAADPSTAQAATASGADGCQQAVRGSARRSFGRQAL